MSQPAARTSGLVQVTVASGSRRVDLVLPGAVPVAELVPELARSVGLLDATTVYGGYRLVSQDGRELAGDSGLTLQGVEDGGLLTVAAGVDDDPPRIYDDVVEAMADVVERDLTPWQPAAGRRTALWAAALSLALGAYTLALIGGSELTAATATVVAVLLASGAVVLSRAQQEPEAAVAVGWMAAGYGAVAGALFAPPGGGLETQVAAAGGGALTAGLVVLLGLRDGRPLLLPVVVVGALLTAGGLLLDATGWDIGSVSVVVLAAVVTAGSVFPWLALGATSTRVEQLYSVADITAEPRPVEPERVRADAELAHQILMAVTATVGILLVLLSPLAVGRGVFGVALATVAGLVMILRTRQYRVAAEVRTGLVFGLAGLATVAASAVLLQPEWRAATAVVLACVGALVLLATLVPGTGSVRRGRLADLAETACLVSMLPLVVMASGLFAWVRS